MNEEQLRRIVREEIMNLIGKFNNVPLDVEKSLSRRLNLNTVPTIQAGSKGATSENQAVNEAGSGTYNVLGVPDEYKFLRDADGNSIGYIAIWTS